ncbi:MAG: hypothetical protein ABI652_00745, partial [Acidobacteriota bacterium]
YAQGQLAVVQQAAYPRGNGSHFESEVIYEFGVRNLASKVGTEATADVLSTIRSRCRANGP